MLRRLTFCIVLAAGACGRGDEAPASGPMDDTTEAEAPAGTEPIAIEPGRISTPALEFAFSTTPDGKIAYFNRQDEDGGLHIWTAAREADGRWSAAEKAAFGDARYDDVDPFVSRSGDRMYFSSTRPRPNAADEVADDAEGDMNTWFLERTAEGWSAPRYAGDAINGATDEVFISEDRDGNIFFTRFGEGEDRERPASLMTARRSGAGFSSPREIAVLPEGLRVTNPAISPEGRTLVGAARIDGPPDLFVSRRNDSGDWSPFEPLGDWLNTAPFAEFAPSFSHDGRELYFTSDRPGPEGSGGRDIYAVQIPKSGL